MSFPPAEPIKVTRRGTCAPSSPSLRRPPSSGYLRERGVGFLLARHLSRRRVLQRVAGQAPPIRLTDVCFSNFSTTSTRTRWFPVRPRHLRIARKRQVLGPTTWPGEEAFTAPAFRFGVLRMPRVRGLRSRPGCYPRPDRCQPTSDVRVASLAPVLGGPCHAFAWVLPGGGRQGQLHRHPVTGDDSPDRRRLPSIKGPFRMGRALAPPRCLRPTCREPSTMRGALLRAGYTCTGLGDVFGVAAATHRTRTTRRLFRPRLRLRSRFLTSEEPSTSRTRPPFTPRHPRGRPGPDDR